MAANTTNTRFGSGTRRRSERSHAQVFLNMVTCPKKGTSERKTKHKREIQKTKHNEEGINTGRIEEQNTVKRSTKMQVTEGTS